jgi:methylated-DNA-[protein]-cysteine S-methyltransferase
MLEQEKEMSFITPSARLFHPIFGNIIIYENADGLYKLTFSSSKINNEDRTKPSSVATAVSDQALDHAKKILKYLEGEQKDLDIPVDWSIFPEFQKMVLKLAYDIPYGSVETYGQLAHRTGNPNSSRAVGAALGKNPIPIVIPCHRVVGADGSLHGYSAPGGLTTKAWLLTLEGHRFLTQPELRLQKDNNGHF